MTTQKVLLAITAMAAIGSSVSAQRIGGVGNVGNIGNIRGFAPGAAAAPWFIGSGYGYGAYGGTTAAQSYMQGQAEVIRAQGAAYQAAARGAVDYEQARAAYMENQQRWHEMQLQRQREAAASRDEYFAAQRAARERRQANQPSKVSDTLSDTVYNRATGEVVWPTLLQQDLFKDSREELGNLLRTKAHTGSVDNIDEQIVQAAAVLREQLRQQIRSVTPHDYIDARRFLDQLTDEIQAGA